jgi:hypothetical protein
MLAPGLALSGWSLEFLSVISQEGDQGAFVCGDYRGILTLKYAAEAPN